jgi:hypothetical protein
MNPETHTPSPAVPAETERSRGAVVALAVGALAVGALAYGAVAIGRLAVGNARIRRLDVEQLNVEHLRVGDLELANVGKRAKVKKLARMLGTRRDGVSRVRSQVSRARA